ncbi:MAG: type II secretion system protein, partial [Tepidisphaeraceae bacterium]
MPAVIPSHPLVQRLARRRPRHAGRGFTLLELLIAIAIIGLILASVVPYIMDKWEMSRRAQCAMNLYIIRDARNAYAKDHGSFPRVRYDEAK